MSNPEDEQDLHAAAEADQAVEHSLGEALPFTAVPELQPAAELLSPAETGDDS